MFEGSSYEDREKFITGEKAKYIEQQRTAIVKLEKEKSSISDLLFNELLDIEVVNKAFISKTELIENPKGKSSQDNNLGESYKADDSEKERIVNADSRLFRLLIREGYIDEHFRTYISYFHEGKVNSLENQFLLNVKDKIAKDFYYTLKNTKEIIDDLDVRYFKHESILNFNLADELIENLNEIDSKKVDAFFNLLKKDEEITHRFISEYFEFTKNKNVFINKLIRTNHFFWEYLIVDNTHSEDKLDEYLAVVINSSEVEDIIKLNTNEHLEIYIEGKKGFVEYCIAKQFEEDKIEDLLIALEIRFSDIYLGAKGNPYSEIIYRNSHYELNEEMVNSLIVHFYGEEITGSLSDEFEKAHYSTLKGIESDEIEPLLEYINQEGEIETYIKNITLGLPNNIE